MSNSGLVRLWLRHFEDVCLGLSFWTQRSEPCHLSLWVLKELCLKDALGFEEMREATQKGGCKELAEHFLSLTKLLQGDIQVFV